MASHRLGGIWLFSLIVWSTNLLWEAAHACALYTGFCYPIAGQLALAAEMAVRDLFFVLVAAAAVGAFRRRPAWFTRARRSEVALFGMLCLLLAATLEWTSVHILERWSYSPLMPTIAGIGLSPLVQLAITGIISLAMLSLITRAGRSRAR